MLNKFMIIFQGWVKPFVRRFRNNMELTNEAIVLVSTYFLCFYSSFVPDPEIRYMLGWYNIWVFIFMILINLTILLFLQTKDVLRHVRLLAIKRNY